MEDPTYCNCSFPVILEATPYYCNGCCRPIRRNDPKKYDYAAIRLELRKMEHALADASPPAAKVLRLASAVVAKTNDLEQDLRIEKSYSHLYLHQRIALGSENDSLRVSLAKITYALKRLLDADTPRPLAGIVDEAERHDAEISQIFERGDARQNARDVLTATLKSKREAAGTADEKPDGQAENDPAMARELAAQEPNPSPT